MWVVFVDDGCIVKVVSLSLEMVEAMVGRRGRWGGVGEDAFLYIVRFDKSWYSRTVSMVESVVNHDYLQRSPRPTAVSWFGVETTRKHRQE